MVCPTILLISRDSALIESVGGVVGSFQGLRLETVGSVDEACLPSPPPGLALVLVHLPVNERLREDRALSLARLGLTVVLSDDPRDDDAQALCRLGIADYLGHPFDRARLASHIKAFCTRPSHAAPQETTPRDTTPRCGQPALPTLHPSSSFYVLDSQMVDVMSQVRRVAPQDTTLLFSGETGTGKTRLARLVHELSPRRQEPFLVLDCGAVAASLIESEIFGHVKGAYTGADRDRVGKLAAAGNGTLLLDEINALPRSLQSRLLRAVDERLYEPVGSNKTLKVQARLIAISNTPLDREVVEGRFRADLFYRLNVVSFHLPPLRDRRGAIIPLANKFLREFAGRNRPDIEGSTPEAFRILEEYDWPGNVRELRNVIERAVALAPGPNIQVKDLPETIRATPSAVVCNGRPLPSWQLTPNGSSLTETREMVEVERICEALTKHGNNRLRAAGELGISRMGLYKKLRKYGLMKFAPRPNGDIGLHGPHDAAQHLGNGHDPALNGHGYTDES